MRNVLITIFSVFFLTMLVVTVQASMSQNMLQAGGQLLPNPWFRATLVDAYLGFLTFYVWVFYKETSLLRRGVWFVLIMALGNMAIAAYVLFQIVRLDRTDRMETVLLRQDTARSAAR